MAKDPQKRIEANPKIAFGKPVIKGTRISVEFILELLESDWSISQITKEYPNLTKEDVLAAVSYAREVVGEWKAYPINSGVSKSKNISLQT
jgi:uncharacterized protein (DUF433 family)